MPVPLSGGHDHDNSSRPKGTFQPASGNTGSSGIVQITYTAPQVSGTIAVTITCSVPDGSPCFPLFTTVEVEVGDLVELGAGTNYNLIGQTAQHSSNHFGTAATVQGLQNLADNYAMRYAGSTLSYNDMSLVQGGLFDISGGWAPPHQSHRFGNNVDFAHNLVPVNRRNVLLQLIQAEGFSVLNEGNHWHLSR